MMIEHKVFAAIMESAASYRKAREHIQLRELSPQGQAWLPVIDGWYKNDKEAQSVDREVLRHRGEQELPEQHLDTLLEWFDSIGEVGSASNVVEELLTLRRTAVGNTLCSAIQSKDRKKIASVLLEYQELLAASKLGKSDVIWTMDDGEMNEMLNRKNLIKLAPEALNRKAGGGAVPGDHILIFGRPEAGKTLFAVNMVAGFLKCGHKVLYIGNEESTYKTRKRIMSALTGGTGAQIDEAYGAAVAKAKELGMDKLFICHMTPGTLPEIEELIKEVKPAVVVLDQIRNLQAGGIKDGMTQRLEEVGMGFRNLLGKYNCVGVSLTQAGDKTERYGQEPPPWLQMSDIDSSRTGLPATVDLLIGVGKTHDLERQNKRAISVCKNKLSDAPDAHTGFVVDVDVQRSRVR